MLMRRIHTFRPQYHLKEKQSHMFLLLFVISGSIEKINNLLISYIHYFINYIVSSFLSQMKKCSSEAKKEIEMQHNEMDKMRHVLRGGCV